MATRKINPQYPCKRLMEEARKVLTDAVEDCLTHQRNADWSKIKLVIRDTMNDFIWYWNPKLSKRSP